MNAPSPPHPADQVLYDYGVGKLQDPAASAVDEHLESCSACRQRVSELSGDSFVGRLRDAGVRPETPASGAAPSGGTTKADGPSNSAPVPAPDPDLARPLPAELADNPQYQVLRELGRGGMGVVYLARNRLMDRLEVLKVLNKEMLERKGTYDRFLREVRAAARLAHPNVVGAYSAVQVGHLLVFAMEYVEGADLSQLVKSRGPLPVAHACSFIHQAASGLQHAHERGMVHRDIKPGNLMLTRQGDRGIVKILDFGLAKASSENPIDGGLTREGQMLGTPDYIAPEQTLDAQKADVRADIYSLGCTLYYLLTGGPPFQGTSLYEILQAHHSIEARPLNLVRPEIPVELAAVVGKMMAKERERRYQTPGDVAKALLPFFKSTKVESGGAKTEVSRVEAGAETTEPAPAGSSTVAARGDAEQSSGPGEKWESLIAVREPEHLSGESAAVAEPARGRLPWVWPTVAVGVLLLVFVVAWLAGVLKFKTEEGDLVFSGLPEQAVVTVDGKVYTIEWPGGKGLAKVTVPAGDHRVKVALNGVEVYGEEVSIETGKQTRLSVRLEARPAPRPGKEGASADLVDVPEVLEIPSPTVEKPRLSLPSQGGDDSIITNSIGVKLVLIPAGEFLLGSPDSDTDARDNEKPQHRVRITRPFYLGVTEITQGQYRTVTGQSPSQFKGSDDLPVEQVTWDDAVNFCNALSRVEGLPPFYRVDGPNVAVPDRQGRGYRLPTEAEWEYACRARNPARYSFGDNRASLGEYAWFSGNSGKQTHPVGQKRPNAFGLFDMHGNVFEWCSDGYQGDFYARSPVDDPMCPFEGASNRVMRGGCWHFLPVNARSANRHLPERRSDLLGFRLARVQSDASPVSPSVPDVIVNPPAPPIEEKTPAPTALAPDARPTPAPEEAPKTITKKSTGPGTRRKTTQASKDAPTTVTNSFGMKLALIPAGEFLMGSPDSDKEARSNEKPQHPVRITRPFYLGVTEVTQGQYRAVTGRSPSHFKESDDLPVEQVSWRDAIDFCNALSRAKGLPLFYRVDGRNVAVPDWKGPGYRLPTDAEWEYACRANNSARYSFGDDPAGLGEYAWFRGNSGQQTHPVGQKRPNAFGLFDMHGNVWEWCCDGYQGDFYARSSVENPVCPFEAAFRVGRGGSWNDGPRLARSALRDGDAPGYRSIYRGFRAARVQSGG